MGTSQSAVARLDQADAELSGFRTLERYRAASGHG